ncbi:MAG: hypothetical protein HGA45_15495 [Chloroflexales bacterium]|nr:hypothetical protein [Chloroflexales bacterium]
MPHAASYAKQIACIESLSNRQERLSVRPLLEFVASVQSVRLSYQPCDTEAELTDALRSFARLRSDGILYVALHGAPGVIFLADGTELSLEAFAECLGTRFAGWVLHFGSCSTLRASPERLAAFAEATGIPLLLGYRQTVDWIESSAMDILIFQALQQYVDLGACWRFLERQYSSLIDCTGLAAYVG